MGLDTLTFATIWQLSRWDEVRIVRLMNAAIWTLRHPPLWKQANGMVICKPGSDAYRP